MASYYLGIDTGGTFTDGVVLDVDQREVLRKAKTLTTQYDLNICIRNIFDSLVQDIQESIDLVSVSTTLATNAIVEGKSHPVGLFLLGYDAGLVQQFDFHHQLGTDRYAFITGGMNLNGKEQAPLDIPAILETASAWKDVVEAFAVSSYAGTVNSAHEEKTVEILQQVCSLPVVQGHQLTTRYNSIRRATTASLNAGLLSTAVDFLNTVRAMMTERGIRCPLIVVRGDGSLVNNSFAANRPVEIIHSGPATSTVGGAYLAGLEEALVVDIGGTTTDLSLLERGVPVMDGGQATVGGFPTSVRTLRSRSFGLGGDSRIRFDSHGLLSIGPERVIPLSLLACQHKSAKADLIEWLSSAPEKFPSDKIEYWILQRAPGTMPEDPRTRKVLELLRDGPKRKAWLLKQAGAKSGIQVDEDRLVRQDIIMRAGLTPTDLLHACGEYREWGEETALLVARAVARCFDLTVEEFSTLVKNEMTRKIAAEIIEFITGEQLPAENHGKNGSMARWLFEENMSRSNRLLGCKIQLKTPIVGIGAPARAFLPAVADALGTEVIFPQHYEVANAVGTVVGNVLVQTEAEVLPVVEGQAVTGWTVRADGVFDHFSARDEAVDRARSAVREIVSREARNAGSPDAAVSFAETELVGGIILITARAVGKPAVGRTN